MHVGDQLRDAGWQQGDVIDAFPGHTWADQDDEGQVVARVKIPGVTTAGLLISQTCDIVADEDKEPFVQIAKVSKSPAEKVEQWRRGHQRRFVISVADRTVADIRYCTSIRKQLLLKMHRVAQVPDNRKIALRNWLADRFARPAVEEDIYEAIFGPGRDYFEALSKRDDRVAQAAKTLSSVRIGILESQDEGLNYALLLVTLDEPDEAKLLDLGELAIELQEAIGEAASMSGWHQVTRERCSIETWETTLPLETTPMTYAGEEITGPEPSEHVF